MLHEIILEEKMLPKNTKRQMANEMTKNTTYSELQKTVESKSI